MLPSPSLRPSPAKELRIESTHRRDRSFENGFISKLKDDDLVLFNEMPNREKDNFLLHASDDFDDSLTNLKHFSDFTFGTNIPARGKSSDLLNADNGKNDYDWLLTPPDTPLFPSIDADGPQQLNLATGRTRSQAISVPRPSLSEIASRRSRSSASPIRLSPIPHSSYNAVQSRPRLSSIPRSSPPPVLRSSTPTRRPSTPTNAATPTARSSTPTRRPSSLTNAATPTARSSTPTVRRIGTGSSGPSFSSGRGGTSPVKPTRGNSASPTLQGWQTDVAGFLTDAPPNLRTSLSDRATSGVRGFSPASSTSSGRNSSSKFGRKSTSPSASRNTSLSRSLERDSFSSYTRISMASSGDDDADSMLSVNVGVSNSCSVRKYGAFANNTHVTFSKKTSRSSSANSALKKSFDSAVRQLDNRKTPQKMFRPLLSSVPATTFYVGRPNSIHRTMFSRNSSFTTSSNASSEQGTNIAPDNSYPDHDRHHLAKGPEIEGEIFTFDKLDEVNDSNNCGTHFGNAYSHEGNFSLKANNKTMSQELDSVGNTVHEVKKETTGTCSKCGEKIHLDMDEVQDICGECAAVDKILASEEFESAMISIEKGNTFDSPVQLHVLSHRLSANKSNELQSIQKGNKCEQRTHISSDSSSVEFIIDTNEEHLSKNTIDCQEKESIGKVGGRCKSQQSEPTAFQGLKVENTEGTDVSVMLMQKSGSSEWPVVHERTFPASNVLCYEPSYGRDTVNAMRRSFGWKSSSPSSSVDLASIRQIEGCMMHQLSIGKVEMDDARSNYNVLTQSTDSHSEIPNTIVSPIHGKIESEEDSFSTYGVIENDLATEEKSLSFEKHNFNGSANTTSLESSSVEHVVAGVSLYAYSGTSISSSNLGSQSSQPSSSQLYDNSVSNSDSRNHSSCECQNIEKDVFDTEQSVTNAAPDCSFDADSLVLTYADDDATHISLVTSQHQEDRICYEEEFMNESMSTQVPHDTENFKEAYNSSNSDSDGMLTRENMDTLFITEETVVPGHLADVTEEPSTMAKAPTRLVQRSFTLEEATDTILFCNSIVHDIAYRAATIGMEKEMVLPEAPRPTVTILGRSIPDQDLWNISSKRIQTSRKIKRKRPGISIKVPNMDSADSAKVPEPAQTNTKVTITAENPKPLILESKCNCSVM